MTHIWQRIFLSLLSGTALLCSTETFEMMWEMFYMEKQSNLYVTHKDLVIILSLIQITL